MARKGWDALKRDTRERYERNGVDKAAYERGESLKAARGHSRTPERPNEGRTKPEFKQYHNERAKLEKDYDAHRRIIWADKNVKTKKGGGLSPLSKGAIPMDVLRWAIGKDANEIIEAIKRDPKRYGGLGYK
jgi:hypothetical protein